MDGYISTMEILYIYIYDENESMKDGRGLIQYSKFNTLTKKVEIYNSVNSIPQEERQFFGLK